MTLISAKAETLSVLDRPNSYIGKTVPRPNLDRLMQGRGLYVSDMEKNWQISSRRGSACSRI